MSVENLTTYERWDIEKLDIPPRSRLFFLEPIGIGTPQVESLTSYISRLAELHCFSARDLIARIIVPIVPKSYNTTNLFCMRNYTGATNGTGELAFDLVQALEKLTLRQNLHYLTLLDWDTILTNRNLLRATKGWCPDCYEEWRLNHQNIYDPLLWNFKVISVCSYHQKTLQTICPHCQKKVSILSSFSRPGYCSKCRQWLGMLSNPSEISSERSRRVSQSELLLLHNRDCGDLLAATPYLSEQVDHQTIANSFQYYSERLTEGNIAAFARLLKIPKNKVWMWQQGQVIPQFDVLLSICHKLQLSLVDFLQRKPIASFPSRNEKALQNLSNPSINKSLERNFDFDRVRQILEHILKDNSITPIPMTEVARRIGHDKRVIHRHFPELCRSISAKYLTHRQQLRSQRIATASEQVRQIVKQIHSEGGYPSEAHVSQFLEKPGIFRDKEVRQAFHEARRSLGFEP
jgi:transcriptional regulator with XRE-family HTH domain